MKLMRLKAILVMKRELSLFIEEYLDCGEINLTKLSEETATILKHDEWCDDESHWIWDLACDVSEEFIKTIK